MKLTKLKATLLVTLVILMVTIALSVVANADNPCKTKHHRQVRQQPLQLAPVLPSAPLFPGARSAACNACCCGGPTIIVLGVERSSGFNRYDGSMTTDDSGSFWDRHPVLSNMLAFLLFLAIAAAALGVFWVIASMLRRMFTRREPAPSNPPRPPATPAPAVEPGSASSSSAPTPHPSSKDRPFFNARHLRNGRVQIHHRGHQEVTYRRNADGSHFYEVS